MASAKNTHFPIKHSFYQNSSFGEGRRACTYKLLKQGKSLVVLGKPSMGKTHFMREICESSKDHVCAPPSSFVLKPEKSRPKNCKQRFVIDDM